jgi:hypothetical protein
MQLRHRFRPQLPRQTSHRFIVRNLAAADARKLAINEIGAHLAVPLVIAPVKHVFEHQQSQHHVGGSALPAARLALLTTFG